MKRESAGVMDITPADAGYTVFTADDGERGRPGHGLHDQDPSHPFSTTPREHTENILTDQ